MFLKQYLEATWDTGTFPWEGWPSFPSPPPASNIGTTRVPLMLMLWQLWLLCQLHQLLILINDQSKHYWSLFFFCTKPYFEHFTKSVSLKSPSNHEMVVTREKNSVKNNSLWSDSFSFCENDFRPKNGRDSMEPSWIPFTQLHLLLTSHTTVVQWLKTRKLTLIGCYRLILFKFYQSSH